MAIKKKIITHNGQYHTDDVCATAVLDLVIGHDFVEIQRTRDEALFQTADFLLDVGGEYNPKKGRFDHHQIGGAGVRPNGVPYATFGLVWKEYGGALCEGNDTIVAYIDQKLVQPIDAIDNGVSLVTPLIPDIYPYTISDYFKSYQGLGDSNQDEVFVKIVEIARDLIQREIKHAIDKIDLEKKVLYLYESSSDKRLIVMPEYYPCSILSTMVEPLYVVYPEQEEGRFAVKALPVEPHSFVSRKPFPESWAGKTGEDLEEVSGVRGAIFCHNKRFIVIAKHKEAALLLAQKAMGA